jgi:hypothetical protein
MFIWKCTCTHDLFSSFLGNFFFCTFIESTIYWLTEAIDTSIHGFCSILNEVIKGCKIISCWSRNTCSINYYLYVIDELTGYEKSKLYLFNAILSSQLLISSEIFNRLLLTHNIFSSLSYVILICKLSLMRCMSATLLFLHEHINHCLPISLLKRCKILGF